MECQLSCVPAPNLWRRTPQPCALCGKGGSAYGGVLRHGCTRRGCGVWLHSARGPGVSPAIGAFRTAQASMLAPTNEPYTGGAHVWHAVVSAVPYVPLVSYVPFCHVVRALHRKRSGGGYAVAGDARNAACHSVRMSRHGRVRPCERISTVEAHRRMPREGKVPQNSVPAGATRHGGLPGVVVKYKI